MAVWRSFRWYPRQRALSGPTNGRMHRGGALTKVLQIITDRDRRGAQVFATDLGVFLAARGLDVGTVALWSGTSDRKLDVPTLSAHRRGLGFLRPLQAEMRRADVVIAHGSRTLMASALASLGVSTPVIYRQISDLSYWARGPFRLSRVRAYLRRMSHAVALWADAAQVLRTRFGFPGEKISIIPNGVRPEVFRPPTAAERRAARERFGLDTDVSVAVCVNALVPEKGVALAVGALRHMPEARLLVVGHGPQLGELQRLAAGVCPGRVKFVGPFDDVVVAYHAADVLLLPSYTEVMPAVVIEASLCGVPIVATRVGAVPTMLRQGACGFLVEHDSIDIARGMAQAFEDRDLRIEARRHSLANYTLEQVGDSWLAVLQPRTGSSLAEIC